MKVEVRCVALPPSEELVADVTRKVFFHLSRFAREVAEVSVELSDPRCLVSVRGPRVESEIAAMSADPATATELALERSAVAVGHSVERSRAALRLARPGRTS